MASPQLSHLLHAERLENFTNHRSTIAAFRFSRKIATYKAHDHDFMEVALVLSGSAIHQTVHGEERVQRGDAIVIRPGAWHGYADDSDLVVYNCCFSPDLLGSDLAWIRDYPAANDLLWYRPMLPKNKGVIRVTLAEGALVRCEGLLDALAEALKDEVNYNWVEHVALLALFLGRFTEVADVTTQRPAGDGRLNDTVRTGLELLGRDIAHEWTPEELSEKLYVDRYYLIRAFRQQVGLPPLKYLAHCRVERGATLLLRTELSVGEIGRQIGWLDQAYFSRRFRAHFGMSPVQYRATLREASEKRFDADAGPEKMACWLSGKPVEATPDNL